MSSCSLTVIFIHCRTEKLHCFVYCDFSEWKWQQSCCRHRLNTIMMGWIRKPKFLRHSGNLLGLVTAPGMFKFTFFSLGCELVSSWAEVVSVLFLLVPMDHLVRRCLNTFQFSLLFRSCPSLLPGTSLFITFKTWILTFSNLWSVHKVRHLWKLKLWQNKLWRFLCCYL